jgi:hypothetical protein
MTRQLNMHQTSLASVRRGAMRDCTFQRLFIADPLQLTTLYKQAIVFPFLFLLIFLKEEKWKKKKWKNLVGSCSTSINSV